MFIIYKSYLIDVVNIRTKVQNGGIFGTKRRHSGTKRRHSGTKRRHSGTKRRHFSSKIRAF